MSSRVNVKYKTKYRVRNWSEYDNALRKRGDVTVWFDEDAIEQWTPANNGRRGAQRRYSNVAILTALTFRVLFRLPFRQSEGFLNSILGLMGLDLKAPDHTTLSRRNRDVEVPRLTRKHEGLEYLWKAAHVFFDRGTPEIETWVLERLERMLEGRISHVVAGMTRMATVRGLSKEQRKPVDKAAQYLLMRRRWGMMRYDELLTIGAPIATGIIEGACRHLINDRMDVTGARWRLPSAEAVLRLRSILSSGDFDKYWRFHEQAEARRNHASRYADGEVPPVKRPTGRSNLRVVRSVD